jgi:hypothetical protein
MTNIMLQGTEAETPSDLVRVCCGLEDADDLVKALYQALVGKERLRLLADAVKALRKGLRSRGVPKARREEVLKSAGEGETVPELDSFQQLAYAVWLNTY